MTLPRDPRAIPAREGLYLEVETGDCPQALLRVLGLLTLQEATPLRIHAERTPAGQRMLLGLEPLDDRRAELLLSKVQAIVSVARAGYVKPSRLRRARMAAPSSHSPAGGHRAGPG